MMFYNAILLFVIWLVFNANFRLETLLIGGFLSLLVSFLFRKSLVLKVPSLKNILYFIKYLFVLLFEIIKANLQVAKVVLSPRIRINSKVVKHTTSLKSKMGKLILANSITLTPGTLTVDVKDDVFYIHYMNHSDGDNAVLVFQKHLEKIYG